MVVSLGQGAVGLRTERALPFLVELVGPAGVGKTTLFRALSQRSGRVVNGLPPYYRDPADMLFFVRQGLFLMPTLLRLWQAGGRRPSRPEIAWMMILQGWHSVARKRAPSGSSAVILDQGPVFLLAQLFWFGPETLKGQAVEKWREALYDRWAAALDLVVWLDASDAVLLERIRTRGKWHAVKDRSGSEGLAFLSRYRDAYRHVITRLATNANGPRVLCINTGQRSVEETLDSILVELGLGGGTEARATAPLAPALARPGAEQGL